MERSDWGTIICCAVLAASLVYLAFAPDQYSSYVRKERFFNQVLVENGPIQNKARDDLPLLSKEEEYGRSLNFERCQVGMDVYLKSGAIHGLSTGNSSQRFALFVDKKTWPGRSDQEDILLMTECYFAAGDSRVRISIPVYDMLTRNPLGICRSLEKIGARHDDFVCVQSK